eukprot:978302-Rhodomonas_salina.1
MQRRNLPLQVVAPPPPRVPETVATSRQRSHKGNVSGRRRAWRSVESDCESSKIAAALCPSGPSLWDRQECVCSYVTLFQRGFYRFETGPNFTARHEERAQPGA